MAAKVKWNTQAATRAVRQAAADALNDAGEFLLQEANETAPIEEATLVGSGIVTPATPSKLTTTVSYDTSYAVRQHEDTRLRHDDGRRAKWLELTLVEQKTKVLKYLAGRMKRRLR